MWGPMHRRPLLSPARAFLLWGMVSLVAGSRAAAQLTPGPHPVTVRIEGVDGPLAANVRTVLEISRAADTGALSLDRAVRLHRAADADIGTALEPFGYYRPRIRKSLQQDGDLLVARYVIDPGPATIVTRVDVALFGEGADDPAFHEAVTGFPLARGDTLRHLPYETAKLGLITLAGDSGYLTADFDTSVIRVDREAATAEIVIHFATGPRYRFGPVHFEQSILDTSFLRTRVPFATGDPYQRDKVLELQAGLAEDPYFERVEVIPRPERADSLLVPIDVVLVPRPPQAFEAGIGYGTDNGPRGRGIARLRRLNRRGHHAEAEIVGSFIERSASVQYMVPAFAHPKGILTLLAGYAILNPATSASRTYVASVRLSRPRLGWRETFSLSWQREAFRVATDSATSTLFLPGASWERTRSDSRIFPSSGIRTRLDLQAAHDGVLSTASLLRVSASGKIVRSLGGRTRALVRAELGRIFTSQFRRLPPTLRFFAGGDQSVRGFGYQSLGPQDAKGKITGGRNLVVGSLELDYRVTPRWAVAVFTDAGNALEDFALDLEQAVGAGVRWISPIGLIRVDGAFPISEEDAPFRIHLSIGPDL
ncbi:MAG TPA: autotransporter assembly complex family protein [Gemmatimonadales bacterium]|nr:autotransporter assembly complex family protein [Gemmatimonadales bacterium]